LSETSFVSLLPVVATLCVSLSSRNVLLGLFSGVILGVFLLHSTSPLLFLPLVITDYLVPEIADTYNASILVLLGFIGGFVKLIQYSGGGIAFAKTTMKYIVNKASAQISAWFSGILIFFSDLGTPLIVGPVFQPLFDRYGISRQKLAFIIDSTSSPIAILIPFIGWGVFTMSVIKDSFEINQIITSECEVFISAIPYQFYAWLAISIVPILSILGFDYGQMRLAESATKISHESSENHSKNIAAIFVWLPLLVLGVTLFSVLNIHGFPDKQIPGSDFRAALASAYFLATVTLISLVLYKGAKKLSDLFSVYIEGISGMLPIAATLILAWALGQVSEELGTGQYVGNVAKEIVSPSLLPLVIFLVSAVISFAIGSSWGTIIIMMPLAIPSALATGNEFPIIIGAVLSGALFGDHSSPISETTILSSIGAGIEPLSHFRTQIPYALTNGIIASIGFLIAGLTSMTRIVLCMFLLQILTIIILRYLRH
jgi:Na+/H+ antiporter NhaC